MLNERKQDLVLLGGCINKKKRHNKEDNYLDIFLKKLEKATSNLFAIYKKRAIHSQLEDEILGSQDTLLSLSKCIVPT